MPSSASAPGGRRSAPALPYVLLCAILACAAAPAESLAACAATGETELTPAAVHQARLEARAADGAYDFSSGALDAAKICADLISRISSVALGTYAVPGVDEIIEAIREQAASAVQDSEREACSYVAGTTLSWARSQAGLARSSANAQAGSLLRANVSVTNPSARSVIATWRSRLMGTLPRYSDLPSLRQLLR